MSQVFTHGITVKEDGSYGERLHTPKTGLPEPNDEPFQTRVQHGFGRLNQASPVAAQMKGQQLLNWALNWYVIGKQIHQDFFDFAVDKQGNPWYTPSHTSD